MTRRLLVFTAGVAALLLLSVAPSAAQTAGGGYLKVKADPGRTGVFVDDKYLGPAANFRFARKYSVAAGEHEVKLDEPRYQSFTTKVTVTAGKTTVVSHKMEAVPLAKPPFGRLRTVGGDKFNAVLVNDKFMGHVDEFNASGQGLLLNPGEYTVKILAPGGSQVHEEKITIQADKVTLVTVK